MHRQSWILLIASEEGGTTSLADLALKRLDDAIAKLGYKVIRTNTPEDALALIHAHPAYGCVVLDWDLRSGQHFDECAAVKIIRAIRARNNALPIFLIADKTLVNELPLEVVSEVHEYIHLLADTGQFIAARIDFAVRRYLDQLLPPYFKALKQFTEDAAYTWDAPGHMGGVAYLKHPVGAAFHNFFGESIMRADIGISTASMGDWLEHLGPPRESERNAARIFGADWTFYVLAGSSNSNRIVCQGAVGADEMVIADRNCHKSLNHGLTISQARVVYFQPTRNGYGMIGLIPPSRLAPEHIKGLIARSSLAAKAVSTEPTYAVVTNTTYDGLAYDVNRAVELLAKSVPRVHFDEAWYAYAKFHPLYRGRFAMGVPSDMPNRPTLFAVQSTHKMLPAFSMASMIHVKPSTRAPLEFDQFNEAFMMHGTTSPFYPMIASIDVATAMMDDPAGPTLMDETIQDAIGFRKAVASVAARLRASGRNDWFFGVFQPDEVSDPATDKSWSFVEAPDDLLAREPTCWTLKPGARWHGFKDADIANDYCMLDPTKVTILCPGIDAQGQMSERGVPGAILTKFLDSRRIEIARTGDYTMLVLFSVGTTKGKWGTLLEALLEFKRLYDEGVAVGEALPELAADHHDRYASMTLKGLCDQMHAAMRGLNLPDLAQEACEIIPDAVLTGWETYQKLVRYQTEKVKVSEMPGRISGHMLVPYPPGIPILMPGERFGDSHSAHIRFLLALEEFGRRFPGFGHEVHGIEIEENGTFWMRAVVEKAGAAAKAAPSPRIRVMAKARKRGRM
ncbi:MAG: Orn/Lys/Arg decarboxylase N-terminal domain-containing protein [Acidobacteriota bacterium]